MIKTLGIIGGGQLALMLIQSASKLGIEVVCLDPGTNSPAKKYASKYLQAEFDDIAALQQLCALSDKIIYEFENIDINSLKAIDETKLYQGIDILHASQNRIREKNLARKSGLKTADFMQVSTMEDLLNAVDQIGYPGILKTCELGYDGKGQIVIRSAADLHLAAKLLGSELIYEQMINFDFEISCVSVANAVGEIASFQPFINKHINGILHESKCQSKILTAEHAQLAINNSRQFIQQMAYQGILCIEFFVKDNEVYFNEMAPRPHNSGHITMDAYNFSQFDLIVNAVADLQIADPVLLSPMKMYNILGQHYDKALAFCQQNAHAKLYLYGKEEVKVNRKMGHINVINDPQLIKKLTREVYDNE